MGDTSLLVQDEIRGQGGNEVLNIVPVDFVRVSI